MINFRYAPLHNKVKSTFEYRASPYHLVYNFSYKSNVPYAKAFFEYDKYREILNDNKEYNNLVYWGGDLFREDTEITKVFWGFEQIIEKSKQFAEYSSREIIEEKDIIFNKIYKNLIKEKEFIYEQFIKNVEISKNDIDFQKYIKSNIVSKLSYLSKENKEILSSNDIEINKIPNILDKFKETILDSLNNELYQNNLSILDKQNKNIVSDYLISLNSSTKNISKNHLTTLDKMDKYTLNDYNYILNKIDKYILNDCAYIFDKKSNLLSKSSTSSSNKIINENLIFKIYDLECDLANIYLSDIKHLIDLYSKRIIDNSKTIYLSKEIYNIEKLLDIELLHHSKLLKLAKYKLLSLYDCVEFIRKKEFSSLNKNDEDLEELYKITDKIKLVHKIFEGFQNKTIEQYTKDKLVFNAKSKLFNKENLEIFKDVNISFFKRLNANITINKSTALLKSNRYLLKLKNIHKFDRTYTQNNTISSKILTHSSIKQSASFKDTFLKKYRISDILIYSASGVENITKKYIDSFQKYIKLERFSKLFSISKNSKVTRVNNTNISTSDISTLNLNMNNETLKFKTNHLNKFDMYFQLINEYFILVDKSNLNTKLLKENNILLNIHSRDEISIQDDIFLSKANIYTEKFRSIKLSHYSSYKVLREKTYTVLNTFNFVDLLKEKEHIYLTRNYRDLKELYKIVDKIKLHMKYVDGFKSNEYFVERKNTNLIFNISMNMLNRLSSEIFKDNQIQFLNRLSSDIYIVKYKDYLSKIEDLLLSQLNTHYFEKIEDMFQKDDDVHKLITDLVNKIFTDNIVRKGDISINEQLYTESSESFTDINIVKNIFKDTIYMLNELKENKEIFTTSEVFLNIEVIKNILSNKIIYLREEDMRNIIFDKDSTLNQSKIKDIQVATKDINVSSLKEIYKMYNKLLKKQSQSIIQDDDRKLNLHTRFWFLQGLGEVDFKILPCHDYPYETIPLKFNNNIQYENYDVVYPCKYYKEVLEHPIQSGKDYGREEIGIHINIIVDVFNILICMWWKFYPAFWGWTGCQAVKGLIDTVYEWYNLETSIEDNHFQQSRADYERIFNWIRWEAEKVILLAKDDYDLRGNYYIGIFIEELINYMEEHHFDTMPLWKNVEKMDEYRSRVNMSPQGDIKWVLDKLKGIRHKIIYEKERRENE